jgi:hypothetical protein
MKLLDELMFADLPKDSNEKIRFVMMGEWLKLMFTNIERTFDEFKNSKVEVLSQCDGIDENFNFISTVSKKQNDLEWQMAENVKLYAIVLVRDPETKEYNVVYRLTPESIKYLK